jgi:GntR family transcriptional regulator, transcriptional repressor for pyruvate dehydrogenase complex
MGRHRWLDEAVVEVALEAVTAGATWAQVRADVRRAGGQHPDRALVMAPFLRPAVPTTEGAFRHATVDLHRAVYSLAGNQVVSLVTQAITHIVTSHVTSSMDLVELRPAILHEHAGLAGAIAEGEIDKARRLMAEHFEAQHDYYRRHWPERLEGLIEWR